MGTRQPLGLVGFLLLVVLLAVGVCDVAGAQTRWPPWQSYGEAEKGARAKQKRHAVPKESEIDALNKKVEQLSQAGKQAEAIAAAKRALSLTERRHGHNHAATAAALTTLAELLIAEKRYADAEPLLKRALAIREKSSPDSPELADTLYALADLYKKQGRAAEAEPLLRRSAALSDRVGTGRKGGAPATVEQEADAKRRAAAETKQAAEQARKEAERRRALEEAEKKTAAKEAPSAAPPPAASSQPPADDAKPRARAYRKAVPPTDGTDILERKSGGGAGAPERMEAPARGPASTDEPMAPTATGQGAPSQDIIPGGGDGVGRALPRMAAPPPSPAAPPPVAAAPPPPAAAAPPPPPAAAAPEGGLAAAQEKWDVVPVFFGTDRAEEANPKRLSYSSDRGRRLELGRALVTVPKLHEVPQVERPWAIRVPYFNVTIYEEAEDPNKHFTMQEIKKLSKADFLRFVSERLKGLGRFKEQALVFVHGYNTSFDNAVYRTAQIAYDLKFDGAPFLYSWPSGGAVASYTYDRESAEASKRYMREFLEIVVKESGAKSVSIIAHSMGNQPLLDVLKDMKSTAPEGVVISQVILAAPDVDADTFTNLAQAMNGLAKGVTLYAASNDRALIVSRSFWGHYRAGDVPAGGPLVLPGVDTIDVTAAGTDAFAINHSGYAQNTDLLKDIGELIETGKRPPEDRILKHERVTTDHGAYWRYAAHPPSP